MLPVRECGSFAPAAETVALSTRMQTSRDWMGGHSQGPRCLWLLAPGLLVGSELIEQGVCLLCTGAVALGQEQLERCACFRGRRFRALECG